MSRLGATVALDARRQRAEGFYAAALVVATMFGVALQFIDGVDWARWWPPLLMGNLVVTGFYFMAGLVLLEKREGTLEAQVVTPLRPVEYLAAKIASLGLLCWLEASVLVVIVSGPRLSWLPFTLGVALLAAQYMLYGFVVVSRYDSITDFLLPSAVWTLLFSLPDLGWFGAVNPIWLLWHPLQPALWLIGAAWTPMAPWQWVYALGYGALWVVVGFRFALGTFQRFVVAKEGIRR